MSLRPRAGKNILLLTATITPPRGVPLLARTDPALRLRDYEEALGFYLALIGNGLDAIVFGENSNSDLGSLRRLVEQTGHEERVEFVSFYGLDHPASYGRGYGEFKLIDHVIRHSRILVEEQATGTVWKATGRYIIRNLRLLLARQPGPFALYCNLRNWPQRWADLYLLAWTDEGYRAVISGLYHELNEELLRGSPEVRFRDLVESVATTLPIVPRFNVTPRVEGVRGRDNHTYSLGSHLPKYYLRSSLCRLASWLWI
jgi:hypothetical protein